MIAYLVLTALLRAWLFFMVALSLIALSDLLFMHPHNFKTFLHRLAQSISWPLALLSAAGRKSLMSGFRPTQGV